MQKVFHMKSKCAQIKLLGRSFVQPTEIVLQMLQGVVHLSLKKVKI